jgi:hypothetical protein
MGASENKQLLQEIFSELAKGNSAPFGESLAEDVRWTITGTTDWSKTYDGLEAVRNDLLAPLREKFADQYINEAKRLIAEDELVVVEARGKVMTKSGRPYNNSYCFIFRLEDGRIKEVTEYLDTELVSTALDGKKYATSVNVQDSVASILKLYELRREPDMRRSRQWYFTEFCPESPMDIIAIFRGGERASANFRMITSYWDMASSFVLNGAIDEKLFFDANTEHVFVYAKIEPFLAEFRQMIQEPDYLLNLEKLVVRTPDFEAKLASRKRLGALWKKGGTEAAAATE